MLYYRAVYRIFILRLLTRRRLRSGGCGGGGAYERIEDLVDDAAVPGFGRGVLVRGRRAKRRFAGFFRE